MTGSRTAYILLGMSFLAMVFFEFISSRKASSRIVMLFGFCLLVFCLGYFLDFFSYSEDGFVAAMINPTNLLIRLENWNDLLSDLLVSPWKFIFGLGIVQNGNYGEYHAVIIDNTYVGILLTAGVLGLLGLSLCFFGYW